MKTAIYPGAFKPPHKGHLYIAQQLVDRSDIDRVLIIISFKNRENITASQSLSIWKLYKKILGPKIKLIISNNSPVSYTYRYIHEHPTDKFVVIFGKEEDDRFESLSKYNNVEIENGGNYKNISASDLRKFIYNKDYENIKKYIPSEISRKLLNPFSNSSNINKALFFTILFSYFS